jgi:RNA polymerase sigma-70 factor (ECF subfamily)
VADSGARVEAEVLLASVDDPAAFRAFYDMWSAQVLAYFQRRVRDPDLALELTAETFAIAFEKRGRFRWMGKSPGAWLFGIAKRILFRHLRHQDVETRAVQRLGIQIPRADDESTRRIEELLDGEAMREAVRVALESCRPGDREILQLHVIDEVPYPEVAAALGCTVNNARVRVHRALARLEQHLADAGAPLMPTTLPDRSRPIATAPAAHRAPDDRAPETRAEVRA